MVNSSRGGAWSPWESILSLLPGDPIRNFLWKYDGIGQKLGDARMEAVNSEQKKEGSLAWVPEVRDCCRNVKVYITWYLYPTCGGQEAIRTPGPAQSPPLSHMHWNFPPRVLQDGTFRSSLMVGDELLQSPLRTELFPGNRTMELLGS